MIIGIPKEIMLNENRVAATPEVVAKYLSLGYEVLVETEAGKGSFISDEMYAASGAKIVTTKEVYEQSDLILKVKEPIFNQELNIHEVDLMKAGQFLITFLHPASPSNHKMVEALKNKGVIGLTLDGIPRISRAQAMDALTSMSTCAGYKGMIMAAETLGKFVPPIYSIAGMIQPAKVVVIGSGVAGLQAIATARRLGAIIYAADIRPEANEQAKSLGAEIINLNIPVADAVAQGGYAKELSEKFLKNERELLLPYLKEADIIFLSALVFGKEAPIIITEEMIQELKEGTVIVDISIDQGGNCELTKAGDVINKNGVIINGINNLPGYLPTSSTYMFSNNVFNLVSYLVKDNKIILDLNDEIIQGILVTDGRNIVHQGTIEAINKHKSY